MKELRADESALVMYCIADRAKRLGLFGIVEPRSLSVKHAFGVRRKPPGDDERNAAARTFDIEGKLRGDRVGLAFELGMH